MQRVVPRPVNEHQRVATIDRQGLTDQTPSQTESFDRITEVACALFDVPIAMINIITSNHEVNKSCAGIEYGVTKDRNVTFCSYTILSDQPLLVEDALSDERFKHNPNVIGGLKVRAYAGMPIKAKDGTHPGSICLIDIKPHKFQTQEINLLKDLAAWAEIELNSDYRTK